MIFRDVKVNCSINFYSVLLLIELVKLLICCLCVTFNGPAINSFNFCSNDTTTVIRMIYVLLNWWQEKLDVSSVELLIRCQSNNIVLFWICYPKQQWYWCMKGSRGIFRIYFWPVFFLLLVLKVIVRENE